MLKFDTLDSTNNYAMQLIDADKAVHGLTILAGRQTAGKGQRGRVWSGEPGESLLMSIIVRPTFELQAQPLFLAAIAVTIADSISQLLPVKNIHIKWPNDIVIADKKAGGILIENVVRGQTWPWAVIGIGLNVGQQAFPESLPHATSLQLATGQQFDIETLAGRLRHSILEGLDVGRRDWLGDYNSRLYGRGKVQTFKTEENTWKGVIYDVNESGQLLVGLPDGSTQAYTHGSVEWVWGN